MMQILFLSTRALLVTVLSQSYMYLTIIFLKILTICLSFTNGINSKVFDQTEGVGGGGCTAIYGLYRYVPL